MHSGSLIHTHNRMARLPLPIFTASADQVFFLNRIWGGGVSEPTKEMDEFNDIEVRNSACKDTCDFHKPIL